MGGEESRESAPGKEENKCNNPKAVNSGWAEEVRQRPHHGWPCSTVYRFLTLL